MIPALVRLKSLAVRQLAGEREIIANRRLGAGHEYRDIKLINVPIPPVKVCVGHTRRTWGVIGKADMGAKSVQRAFYDANLRLAILSPPPLPTRTVPSTWVAVNTFRPTFGCNNGSSATAACFVRRRHRNPILIRAPTKIARRGRMIFSNHVVPFKHQVSFDHYSSTNSQANRDCAKIYLISENHCAVGSQQTYCEHDKMFLPDRFVRAPAPIAKRKTNTATRATCAGPPTARPR